MPSAMKAENGLSPSMNRITYLLNLRITGLLNQRKTEMRARGGFLPSMHRIACLLNLRKATKRMRGVLTLYEPYVPSWAK